MSTAVLMRESELFDYIHYTYVPDLKRSTTYDSWDCVSKDMKMVIELKSRNTHYDNLMIEQTKYNKLMVQGLESGFTPWYINSTPNGVYAFNLIKLVEPIWESRPMPKTTEFIDQDDIPKIVGYLNIKDAIKM